MNNNNNGWRIMWVLVAFDLPTTTKQEIKRYTQFRNFILEENFMPFQFSVYLRHFSTVEIAKAVIKRIGAHAPDNGKISCFLITDKQFGMTNNFYGKYTKYTTDEPEKQDQFLLFKADDVLE